MNTPLTRRGWLQATLAASAALGSHPAQACEYFAPTLRVTHPWTRAAAADAAFAVLGMRFDEVTEDDQLLHVQTPVAAAVVYVPGGLASPFAAVRGLPLDIPAGRETLLGSADLGHHGPHLRLLGLTQDLAVGRSYPLTLIFKKGGTVKALLSVDYARFS